MKLKLEQEYLDLKLWSKGNLWELDPFYVFC